MAKVNDKVRFLNQVGGGRITRIEGKLAYVEDEDGFETPALINELVVVKEAKSRPTAYDRPLVQEKSKEVPAPVSYSPSYQPELPVEETPEGEKLNVVLAYEPKEIKHLNTTTFYAYLVNDSNYYLYFTYMTRSDEEGKWIVRYNGVVEPNIQILLEEFPLGAVNDMGRVAVQYLAFKQDKPFALKNPALVEHRLDGSKFCRLHCFHDNEYFDSPVIALDIVKNDVPVKQIVIDSGELERAMRIKRAADKPTHKPVEKKKRNEIPVIDLHINELVDTTAGMSPTDILTYQLAKFRETMDANMKHAGTKLIFIHGKGEGVLRKALLDELKRRYPRCTAQDASFLEYGFGATQITIH